MQKNNKTHFLTRSYQLLIAGLVWLVLSTSAWANGDQLLGVWLSPEDKATIEIYQQDGKYFGRIVALKEPLYPADDEGGQAGQPKVDRNNPDESLRDRPVIGLNLLRGFSYKGESKGIHEWHKGKIYDPGNGKDYKCTIKLNADGTLNLRGYIGISLIGRTQVWRPKP